MKDKYKEKKLCLIRAFEHYIKIKNNFDLITNKDINSIKDEYKKFLINILLYIYYYLFDISLHIIRQK